MMDTYDAAKLRHELERPLDRAHVATRQQSGRALSYIEAHHAIREANAIFGPLSWTRETLDMRLVAERERKIGKPPYEKDGWGVSYLAKVRVIVGGLVKEGTGAGHGIDADLGLAHESAAKEAESDAMKRALMMFGDRFGLALYDKSQANVVDTPPAPKPTTPADAGPAKNPDTPADAAPKLSDAADYIIKTLARAPDMTAAGKLTAIPRIRDEIILMSGEGGEDFNAVSRAFYAKGWEISVKDGALHQTKAAHVDSLPGVEQGARNMMAG